MTHPRLTTITTLHTGNHKTPTDGLCLLEAVAYVNNEPHTDHPTCTSPILGAFGRRLNDVLPDHLRNQLIPLIPHMIGTNGDGHDQTRGYMALDWLIRVYTPAWLDLAGLTTEAAALRDLGRIVDLVSAQRAAPVVREGKRKAAAAGAAAWAAARDAAWDAAGAAAWAAAGAAARDAAGAAAWAAAWDAAWDAARDAAGDAARDAAGAAAGAAAWAAARDAARDAAGDAARDAAGAATRDATRAAARDATRDALKPTVEQLQLSAINLLTAMCNPTTNP